MDSATPSAFDRARRWLKQQPASLWVWAAASVFLVGLRFARWQDVPFINDEAAFLSTAREQVAAHSWVSASPIAGTQGMRYGPSVLWFYALVQHLFGSDARTSIGVMCLLVSVAHALAVLGIGRAFQLRALPLLSLAAFVASSSYQLFWARLAWDQLVNVCGSLLLLVLSSARLSLWHGLGLGLAVGTALSSHLFCVPLVACVCLVLLLELWREPKQALRIGALAAAVALLINLPYLRFLAETGLEPQLQTGTLSLGGSLSWLVVPAEVAGFAGFEYFLDADWAGFVAGLGERYDWMRFSQAPNALALLALFGLGCAARTGAAPAARRLARLSLITWIAYTLFYDSRDLTHHPHYTFPYWWVIAVGLAGLLAELQRTSLRYAQALFGVIALVAVAQLAFLESWREFVGAQGGTRGIHYGTPVARQYDVLAQACSRAEPRIQIANQTVLFDHALSYVAETEPRCRGKQVRICKWSCPPPDADEASWRLAYRDPSGGEITLLP